MTVGSTRRNESLRWLVFALGWVAFAGTVRADPQRLTVRVLGTTHTSLSGKTSRTEGSQITTLAERRQWYGAELDWRPLSLFSLDLSASQGGIDEIHFAPPRSGSGELERTIRTATLRHLMLSPLYHPVSLDHQVDFYLGPEAGIASLDGPFASSRNELAYGGKIGFDVRLGSTPWSVGGDLTILSNRVRIFGDSAERLVTYSRFAAGVAYRWRHAAQP